MGGGGKSQTSTSKTTIPPEVLARYNSVNATAEKAAATPFQQYSTDPNAFVAPLTDTQNAGIANTNAAANMAQPYYQGATGLTLAGLGPANLGALDTDKYMSPFLNDVVSATAAQQSNQNAQQSSALQGSAIQAGAFGGDRSGIAQGNLANQQNLANSQVLAGLLNSGYQNAQGVAQQQQGATLSADQANLARLTAGGSQLAGIGNQAQTSAEQGAAAQLSAGQQQQQTTQAGLTALYNQFLQQQSYPFQTAQFLANIAEGTGALSGSTTSTTSPSSFFSDKRLKEDIEPIGKTFDGQNIVKFKYKGKPGVQMGLIAQDVEKKHPSAVGLAGGYRTVDYDEATKHAAERGHFRDGGLIPLRMAAGGSSAAIDTTGMSPYSEGGERFEIQPLVIRHLLQGPPVPQSKQENTMSQLMSLGDSAKSLYSDGNSIWKGINDNSSSSPNTGADGHARGGRAGLAGGGSPYDVITSVGTDAGDGSFDPSQKPGTGTDASAAPSFSNNGSGQGQATGTYDHPIGSEPTHGGGMGAGTAANMRRGGLLGLAGGRAGYDAGGGLPYEDDLSDPENQQTPDHKPKGLSIPDQANTHGLMTAQNPSAAPTSGIGGIAGAAKDLSSLAGTAKSIYGLGSGLASALAPSAAAGTAAAAAPAAIGAAAAPAAAGLAGAAGTAAAGAGAAGAGGSLLSTLAMFLPFLATGGSVDRKGYDDGGTVLQDLSDDDLAKRLAQQADSVVPRVKDDAVVPVPATPAPMAAVPTSDNTEQTWMPDVGSVPKGDYTPPAQPTGLAGSTNSAAPVVPDVLANAQKDRDAAYSDAPAAAGLVPATAPVAPPSDVAPSDVAAAAAPEANKPGVGLVPDLPAPTYIKPVPIKKGKLPPDRGNSNAATSFQQDSHPSNVPLNQQMKPPVPTTQASAPNGGDVSGGQIGTNPFLKLMARGESGGDYNKVYANGKYGKPPVPVTQMTAQQAANWSDATRRKYGLDAAPLGGYQIIGSTMQGLINSGVVKPNEILTPATQDKLAIALGKQTGGDPSKIKSTWVSLVGDDNDKLRQAYNAGVLGYKSNGDAVYGSSDGSMPAGEGGGSSGYNGGLAPSSGGIAPNNAGTNAVGGIAPEGQGGIPGWFSNPDNRNIALSVLSGLGKMASSNSRYLGAAALQGLGGGADTYAALQKQAADIGQTHARTVTEQQQANLTAAAAKQTTAETAKTGVETAATRYEKTYLPTGIMIRDVTKPNEPPKIIQYGQLDPTTGQIATKDANTPVGTTTGGADGGAGAPAANVNEQGLPAPQVPGNIPMTYLQFTPDGQRIAAEEGSSALSTARTQSTAAQQTNQQLADMSHSLSQLPTNGVLAPGSGFGSRLDFAKTVNTATQAMGLGSPFDENAIAQGEDLGKQTTRLGFALSRSLGSQEAAGITERAIESVPGGANSPAGAQRIISSLKAANQRQIDYYNFAQQWVGKTGGAITGMDAAFNKAAPPELYALSAFVPAQAMAALRADPKLAADFDKKYGSGYSKYVLGQ